jgi:hypothetical protein
LGDNLIMPVDKTGRNIHRGQLVDVNLTGMFTGSVIDIEDHRLVNVQGGQQMPPAVIVQVIVPVFVRGNQCDALYVVKQVDQKLLDALDAAKGNGKVPSDSLDTAPGDKPEPPKNITKFPSA